MKWLSTEGRGGEQSAGFIFFPAHSSPSRPLLAQAHLIGFTSGGILWSVGTGAIFFFFLTHLPYTSEREKKGNIPILPLPSLFSFTEIIKRVIFVSCTIHPSSLAPCAISKTKSIAFTFIPHAPSEVPTQDHRCGVFIAVIHHSVYGSSLSLEVIYINTIFVYLYGECIYKASFAWDYLVREHL